MKFDAFERERSIIKRAELLLSENDGGVDFKRAYLMLLDDYKKLLKVSSRLIRMSDRSEQKLKLAEEALSRANERMENELNVGREIQMKMVPFNFDVFSDRKEFSINAILEPAREVGGDFYDFFFINDDWLCVTIGDVSGKGVPAALFMAVTKTMIKTRAADDFSPASIITHVNDELSLDNPSCMFVTVFIGLLNTRTGELIYTNAGHNPPYIKRKNGQLLTLDQRHGPVIGAMDGLTYKQDAISLGQGDRLILFTDGVTEAMDINKTLFSAQRLTGWFTNYQSISLEKLVSDTLAEIMMFTGEAEQADDITILAIEYHGDLTNEKSYTVDFFIKNKLPEIEKAKEQFNEFAQQSNIPKKLESRVFLVFDEILTNIISYAYADQNDHRIELKLQLTDKHLKITISDDGMPFNPFTVDTPDTSLSLEEREIGGLGIHLVKNVMDEVSYQRRIEKNVVVLIKHIG